MHVGDLREIVVRIDADDAAESARRAIAFLVSERVVTANPDRVELRQPSEWVAGPAAESVVEPLIWTPGWRQLRNTGVDVVVDRQVHHAVENYEPPACPTCSATLDEAAHHDLLENWWSTGREPTVSCRRCGCSALLGEWPSEWPSVVGAPAVVFNNWPQLTGEFLRRLRAHLGGRTEVVRAHF